MNQPLRVLHLEDNPDYSALVKDRLTAEGLNPELVCVETRDDFLKALESQPFDLIIADFFLPTYDGIKAIKLAQEKTPDTPVLLVSGTIGEEAAIESLKAGATDYVLKHWPERLIPAVRRALRESEERRNRLQAESTLSRREKLFRALSENALDIVTILDREGNFLYNSISITRMLGYDPAELHGRSAFSLMETAEVPRLVAALQLVVAQPDTTVTQQFRYRHKDNSWRDIEAVARSLLHDPDIAGVVVNSRDVTDRRLTEQALRESERRFRDLFEGSPDAILVQDLNGCVLDANPAAARLHELTREELIGRNSLELMPPEKREPARRTFEKLARGELHQVEFSAFAAQGREVPVEIRTSRIDYNGKPALLLHVRDISERKKTEAALRGSETEQKRLEEQLRQSQKMEAIGQLAGGVAHDFNNILTVIQGHASLLRMGGLQGPAAGSAEQIAQASERAAGLTRQLLTFSRRQMMQPKQLHLPVVVSNMTRMLGRILREDITLQFDYAPNIPAIHADVGMIEQVLLNLTVNSRDAMPLGGRLTIRISKLSLNQRDLAEHPDGRPGEFVCLSVADTGCGIEPENLPHIFEPFFTTKEVGRGTGLGLATVYGIIKQHQGWTEVSSELNVGTRFEVFLPATDAPVEATMETSPSSAPRGGSETILVVEDEPPVRELVCQILKTYGYQVLEASSGVTALKVWRENMERIDLLLTDIVMPDGMNGRDLAQVVQAAKPGIKAIFSSGYSADIVGKDFIMQKGLNFLQKPYQPEKLARAVRECLDGK